MANKRSKRKKKCKKQVVQQSPVSFTADEYIQMMHETSQTIVNENQTRLSSMTMAASESEKLVNNVEFWNWMNRNYSASGHFASSSNMQNYLAGTDGQRQWASRVVQGKGYEWDWMTAQRRSIKNIFKTYDAGDVANRPGSDVTIHNLLDSSESEVQLKAYTSKNKPHLKNTPKDMTVVTNAEKVDGVRNAGYESTEAFGNVDSIKKSRDKRLAEMQSGKATPNYNIKNVGMMSAKAGILGFSIGAGGEIIISYRKWKAGEISTQQYLKEIMKSGGNSGIVATASAAIMIPVTATITTAGLSCYVTIPVAFVVSTSVDKIIAPAFSRGEYKKIIAEAKYYQNMTEFCGTLAKTMEVAGNNYIDFVSSVSDQISDFDRISGNTLGQKAMEDLEYLASLSEEETTSAISGMIALISDTDAKVEELRQQNFISRMLKTITSKNNATREDIQRNYEQLTVYVSKAIEITLKRQTVNEKVILMYGEQIMTLMKSNIRLYQMVMNLTSRVDNLSSALIYVSKPNQEVASVKQIASENAVKKYETAYQLFARGELTAAYILFKEAADNNVSRAYYFLGEYFAKGYAHIKENKEEALEYWRKGMNLGDPLSTYEYGALKYDTDKVQCRKWCKDNIYAISVLMNKNDPVALCEYGWHILSEHHEDLDSIMDALDCFHKGAKENYWPAAYMFYLMTEDIRRTGTKLLDYSHLILNVEWYQIHLTLASLDINYGADNYMIAAKHLARALYLRDDVTESAAMLAMLLNAGVVEDSLSDGLSNNNVDMYYKAGLECNNPIILYQMGTFYYNGFGANATGKNLAKAYESFYASYLLSKQGFTAGMLGYMTLFGEGSEENDKAAVEFLFEGYRQGDPGSTDLLSTCYRKGFGVDENIEMAEKLHLEASKMQVPDSREITQHFFDTLLQPFR